MSKILACTQCGYIGKTETAIKYANLNFNYPQEVTFVEELNFNGSITYTIYNSPPNRRMIKERYGV